MYGCMMYGVEEYEQRENKRGEILCVQVCASVLGGSLAGSTNLLTKVRISEAGAPF
jgi:hypothetical protein